MLKRIEQVELESRIEVLVYKHYLMTITNVKRLCDKREITRAF